MNGHRLAWQPDGAFGELGEDGGWLVSILIDFRQMSAWEIWYNGGDGSTFYGIKVKT